MTAFGVRDRGKPWEIRNWAEYDLYVWFTWTAWIKGIPAHRWAFFKSIRL